MSIFYGECFETASMTDTSMSVRFTPGDETVLRALRTWLIFNNYTGSFTSMVGKLYSDRSGSPGALIATSSNSFSKAQIITENSGVKEIYFLFDDISLSSNLYYHLVINCSGYTATANSHIAWRKAWPDPVYRAGWSQTFENLGIAPYFLTVIGAEL
jgi:hypothetical protein